MTPFDTGMPDERSQEETTHAPALPGVHDLHGQLRLGWTGHYVPDDTDGSVPQLSGHHAG